MKYQSTRGGEHNLSFEEVLFAGYAKDGGLYMPQDIPVVTMEEMKNWRTLTYPQIMVKIARKFIDSREIPDDDLQDVITNSLKNFRIPEVIAVKRLKDDLNIVELFHGATMAFKDLALSMVGGFLNYFLSRKGRHVTVLVGTSGDTGSAAIQSVRNHQSLDIIVLLPDGRCTLIQELQMTTVMDDNVHVYCVEGTSDDLDLPIKKVFSDPEYVKKHNLISINSINWGRILGQIPHYFFTYFSLCDNIVELLEIVVPTGAAGNITSGCIAKQMGLPIRLVAAVNVNDIVSRTLKHGDFSKKDDVIHSFSSAMDIQVPYNIERLLFLFNGRDSENVAVLMNKFEQDGKLKVPKHILEAINKIIVDSYVADDKEVTTIMSRVYKENEYVLCPHSAVAVKYHFESSRKIRQGFIATASPAKFPEAVLKANCPVVTDGVDHLSKLPTKSVYMRKEQDWYSILKNKIELITANISKH